MFLNKKNDIPSDIESRSYMAGLLLDCCFSEKTESFEHSLALLRTYPRMHFNGLSFHTNRTVIVEMCAGFYTLGNSGFPAAAELPPQSLCLPAQIIIQHTISTHNTASTSPCVTSYPKSEEPQNACPTLPSEKKHHSLYLHNLLETEMRTENTHSIIFSCFLSHFPSCYYHMCGETEVMPVSTELCSSQK